MNSWIEKNYQRLREITSKISKLEDIDELFQFIRSQEKHTETRSIKWQDLRDKLVELMDNNDL